MIKYRENSLEKIFWRFPADKWIYFVYFYDSTSQLWPTAFWNNQEFYRIMATMFVKQ